jgi:hypothetical protein
MSLGSEAGGRPLSSAEGEVEPVEKAITRPREERPSSVRFEHVRGKRSEAVRIPGISLRSLYYGIEMHHIGT